MRRHDLVRLSPAGWDAALAGATCGHEAIARWRRHDHPLVVARQDGVAAGAVRLGLPAPGRVRATLTVEPAHLRAAGGFPAAREIAPLLEAARRAAWRALAGALPGARVFGGYGWQWITGLAYVHAGSDLDLIVPVADARQADAAAQVLARAPAGLPRLDGELVFRDGSAVAWREWAAWRAGRAGELLVKRLDGVRLERDAAWTGAAEPA